MSKKEYPYQNTSLIDIRGEKWKDIPGYEDQYQLSNYGRVKSRDRWDDCGKFKRFRPGRIRNLNGGPGVNLSMQLHKHGKCHGFSVARYVYYLFVKPFDIGDRSLIVTWKDGDFLNCHYKNLVLRPISDVAREVSDTNRQKSQSQLQTEPANQHHHYLNLHTKNIQREKWAAIKGFEDLFEISDHGRVKSVQRLKKYITPEGDETQVRIKEFIVRQDVTKRFNHHINKPLYALSVTLKKEGNTKGFAVCRLVYQTFGEDRMGLTKKIIMHKDGDNFNNHISNLHPASRTEVHKASYAKNRRKSPFASLTPKQRRAYTLRIAKANRKPVAQYSLQHKRIAIFDSQKAAAKATGTRSSAISNVLNGRLSTAGGFIWKRVER